MHLGIHLQFHGPLTEEYGRRCLIKVVHARTARHDDAGLAHSGQRVLQQACQLGLTVGHVRLLTVDERVDNTPEDQQRPVDAVGLSQPHSLRGSLLHFLTTCKIHKDQSSLLDITSFASTIHILLAEAGPPGHVQHEHRVATAAVVVHECFPSGTTFVTLQIVLQALPSRVHGHCGAAREVNSTVIFWIVSQLNDGGLRCTQQILDDLIVDLNKLQGTFVLVLCILLNPGKDLNH
mmetsp:Transcript_73892/g.130332  ORF Transcript_73892/g.130332 Transcript_73892/m.130332 type:complete len:235 (-) Transcript_73892:375-1079(-)